MACWLTFDVANLGMLVATWSESEVEGALAVLLPNKAVPKFKFKQNGGRTEVIRKIRDDHKKLFQGWCEFIKSGKDYDCNLEIIDPAQVKVVFNRYGEIEHCSSGELYHVIDYSGVFVCGKDNDAFFAVKTLSNQQFLDIGLQKGYSLQIA